ncbi:hypothetical protein PSV08DRAFT_282290 [Bipolaris maydis]|uniref:uncharacterized protein n=1 Tax=Cochliobolus heterostrophus TaxID=5016 RepID=UPI0024D77181|nr:hypothetical protein J3E73DRAFT_291035 [Bipolaris maydis]KAJ6272797.1 hypothetical protein PSV08DRAFT_282290 [Bipolaris maydis]KAJ6279291.1 hypothetical protein J3E71DRAFT_312778 [Bipolaris maydis]
MQTLTASALLQPYVVGKESGLKQKGTYTSFSSSFSLAFTWSFPNRNKPIRARCAHPCQRQIRITRHLLRTPF